MLKENIQWSPYRQYESATDYEPVDFFSEIVNFRGTQSVNRRRIVFSFSTFD